MAAAMRLTSASLCEIIEETIELYRQDGKSLVGRNFLQNFA